MENKSLMEQIARKIWEHRYSADEWIHPDNLPYLALAQEILSLLRSQDIGLTEEEICEAKMNSYADYRAKLPELCGETEQGRTKWAMKFVTQAATAKSSLKIAALEEENRGLRAVLKLTENDLDLHNGNYGNEKELCLCCHSKETGMRGIIHEAWCPIQQARQALKSGNLDSLKDQLKGA